MALLAGPPYEWNNNQWYNSYNLNSVPQFDGFGNGQGGNAAQQQSSGPQYTTAAAAAAAAYQSGEAYQYAYQQPSMQPSTAAAVAAAHPQNTINEAQSMPNQPQPNHIPYQLHPVGPSAPYQASPNAYQPYQQPQQQQQHSFLLHTPIVSVRVGNVNGCPCSHDPPVSACQSATLLLLQPPPEVDTFPEERSVLLLLLFQKRITETDN